MTLYRSDEKHQLNKYTCRGGIPIYVWSLSSDVKMQFQTSASVPASGSNLFIVEYDIADGYCGELIPPVGALYLIMSVKAHFIVLMKSSLYAP